MDPAIGIQEYITDSDGSGGIIKQHPEDFIVTELSVYPRPTCGKHTIVRITSKNWETHHLIETLASILKIPFYLIGYAGIKDKRAVTSQLMSLPVTMTKISQIRLSDISIEILYSSSKPIYKGMLIGNHFTIKIRDVTKPPSEIKRLMDEITKLSYFPNFFGVQRFGSIRPISQIVGKHILKNELKEAVMSYIANPILGEPEETYIARKQLQDTYDFIQASESYPKHLHYERRMIEYLAIHPGEWLQALQQLPLNLLQMFLHAYQSYLFNKILSKRVEKHIPYDSAIIGDIVIPWDKELQIQSKEGILVNSNNVAKVNSQIQKYRCAPTGAIIGHNGIWASGDMGEIEQSIYTEENLQEEWFTMSHLPQYSANGMRRVIACPLKHMRWELNEKVVTLQFSLPKGCYATTILREIMKDK